MVCNVCYVTEEHCRLRPQKRFRCIVLLQRKVEFERLVCFERSMQSDAHPLDPAHLQLRRRRQDIATTDDKKMR